MLHEIHTLSREETGLIENNAIRMLLADYGEKYGLQAAVKQEECLYFDIETTGLSASESFIFLIGCISYDREKWMLHQYFIRFVQEERALLSAFFDLAAGKKALIHFNGNTFDIPFIKKRAAANHLQSPLNLLISVDLYQWFRPLKKKLDLSHMNQSFLEKQAGWERADKLSGADVVSLFWNDAARQSDPSRELLLGHNHDDLIGMLHILPLEGYLALFSGRISSEVSAEETKDHTALLIRFALNLPLPERSDSFQGQRQIQLRVSGSSGELCIHFFNGTLRYYFPDYKNYYYLPMENQAIHKSVAVYVAKEYRTAAKPENCFAALNGQFLPVPGKCPEGIFSGPVLRESYDSKDFYIEYRKEFFTRQETLAAYARLLLSEFEFTAVR